MRQFLAASEDRLYVVSGAGRLAILDAKSGARIGELPVELLDLRLTNVQTDRVVVADKSGLIQCLREIQREWPLVHASAGEATAGPQPEEEDGLPAAPEPAPVDTGPVDPFTGAPLGAPAGTPPPTDATDNPFEPPAP